MTDEARLDELALKQRLGTETFGTAVKIWRGGKVLLGRRIKPNGDGRGMHALPGGAVEEGEAAIDAAIREIAEETAIVLMRRALRPTGWFEEGARSTLYFSADVDASVEAENVEPHKCERWEWYDPASPEFAALDIWDGGRGEIEKEYQERRQLGLGAR